MSTASQTAEYRRIRIPGELARVAEACDFVVQSAESAGLESRAVYHCQLAVDEWCTNIIQHGFQQNGRTGAIEVTCIDGGGKFHVRIVDDCPPFDPMLLGDVDTTKPLEEREPGGLGWFLIRKVMDEVDYRFENGYNQLTMTKLNPASDNKQPAHDYPVYEAGRGVMVMRVAGRIDANEAQRLERALIALIEAGNTRLVLHLEDLQFINSSGLKALASAYRLLRTKVKQSGTRLTSIALAAMKPNIEEVINNTGYTELFEIRPTLAEAVAVVADS